MSELLYAGKTIAEVAGYDDLQTMEVVFRKRDANGSLVRGGGLPPGVNVDADGMRIIKNRQPLERVYKKLKKEFAGLTESQADEQWERFRAENPTMGRGGV